MGSLKLTKDEFSFFAEHAPHDFDLSVLHAEPYQEGSDAVIVDKDAFIAMAGKTDHAPPAPIVAANGIVKGKKSRLAKAMVVIAPAMVMGLLVVLVLLVVEMTG